MHLRSAMSNSVLEARKFAELAAERAERQNYEAAIKFYQLAIEKNHKEPSYYLAVADCHIACEQFDHAIHNAQTALDLNSKSWRAYMVTARALCGLKKFEEAERNHLKAKQFIKHVDPTPADCLLLRLRTEYLKSLGFDEDVSKMFGKSSSSCEEALQQAMHYTENVKQAASPQKPSQTISSKVVDERSAQLKSVLKISGACAQTSDKNSTPTEHER